MGMIVTEDFKELMIDRKTGRRFFRELCREEKADIILGKDESLMDASTKLKLLQELGYDLEEILDMALNFES